ncbi:hypothetical protein X797_010598 [Metarhizium robertsii]|uniref:Uncharacterized protein n=1 Tax=Metarhizium robertsii TaxID=568076 RepID=A0A0A1UMX7_9HYPO|nr:hypothetical protein X797_010598 [Metarhizium robertsii]
MDRGGIKALLVPDRVISTYLSKSKYRLTVLVRLVTNPWTWRPIRCSTFKEIFFPEREYEDSFDENAIYYSFIVHYRLVPQPRPHAPALVSSSLAYKSCPATIPDCNMPGLIAQLLNI